jgi:cysteine desulfurase/selenocysteine lyase
MTSAVGNSASIPEHRPVAACREDFPALAQAINGEPLVYLDSAASSQLPDSVIDAVAHYQRHDHANVHRGVHTLSHRATEAYEGARDKVQSFINAANRNEVIFTRGTTEAINLVAQSFSRPKLKTGDKIVITHLEHHSNIVPWQLVCEQTGAELVVAPVDQSGQVDEQQLISTLDEHVRILAIAHVSNALGTILPVKEITQAAHERGIPVLVDGAQAVPHSAVDVRALDADFYAFSGHKMFAPTGIGILYGKEALLDAMPPYQGGGDMILEVRFDGTTYNALPYKFEAGTPNISGAVGLGASVDYLNSVGIEEIASHESELLAYMTSQLERVDGIRLIGTARHKASVQSFLLGDIHPHDIGTILDHQGVAIRTGHHCAMPVMDFFGVPGTARASLALYNNVEDVDRLIVALKKTVEIFA